jgi:hypothetical protein
VRRRRHSPLRWCLRAMLRLKWWNAITDGVKLMHSLSSALYLCRF